MSSNENPSHGASDGQISQSIDTGLEPRRSTGWVSDAQKRTDGQIGTGLLHNIELRIGSVA